MRGSKPFCDALNATVVGSQRYKDRFTGILTCPCNDANYPNQQGSMATSIGLASPVFPAPLANDWQLES
jgi:hypothetical protein